MGKSDPSADKHLRLHDHLGLEDACKVLGDLRHEFRSSIANMIAGVILGVGMIGGAGTLAYFGVSEIWNLGGNMPFWAEKGMCWGAALFGLMAVALLGGGGGVLLWIVFLTMPVRVQVHEHGFVHRLGAKRDLVAWSDIAAIKEIVLYERLPLLKGPAQLLLPKVSSRSYAVSCHDGKSFNYDVNSFKNVDHLGEILRKVSDDGEIPWTVEEIDG